MTDIPPVAGLTSLETLDRQQSWQPASEPLVKQSDVVELRDALDKFRSGAWDDGRWTAFRLRYGIYGQLQPGVQMVRIKIPGGIVTLETARGMAEINRRFAKGDVHLTTRQDFQIYHVPTDAVADLYLAMSDAGLTAREGCGNTLRNMTSCALAGICPREHVDAGLVAQQLSTAWLRNPLVQNMPRKFKATVSGCATDCGASGIHDFGAIAVEENGRRGFRILAGGGTGGQPIAAVQVLDFITEDALPTALEAAVRLHQRFSNRVDRNKARLKFLVKRFGADKFRSLFQEEFERLRALPQRPWEKLAWRTPADAPEPTTPHGVFDQHDGGVSIVITPPLGLLSSDQLEAVANIAETNAGRELRLTREQNLAIVGLSPAVIDAVIAELRSIGLPVQEQAGGEPDLISCPGTTTCRIGITNSQDFGRELEEVVRSYTANDAAKKNLRVRISGCQNGCGLHHVGDFGFRGMGKKINGKVAPHYQIYIGGDDRTVGAIGIAGPIVPAKQAKKALKLLLDGYDRDRQQDESVRSWAHRLDKEGLAVYLAPLNAGAVDDPYVDWGKTEGFTTPAATKAECATAVLDDSLFQDMADDALITLDRALIAGDVDLALESGRAAFIWGARRLLNAMGQSTSDDDTVESLKAWVRLHYAGDVDAVAALQATEVAEDAAHLTRNGTIDKWRESLAVWLDLAELAVRNAEETLGLAEIGALADSGGAVADLLKAQEITAKAPGSGDVGATPVAGWSY